MSDHAARETSPCRGGCEHAGPGVECVCHPADEMVCDRCKRHHGVGWFAPSDVWNKVMREGDRGKPDEYGFCCPICFIQLASERGVANTGWLVCPFDDGPVDRAEQIVFVSAGGAAALEADMRERLAEWADDAQHVIQSVRYHEPQYKNPAALRRDVRALLADHGRLTAELAEWKLEAERRGLPKELMQRLHRGERLAATYRKALEEIAFLLEHIASSDIATRSQASVLTAIHLARAALSVSGSNTGQGDKT